MQYKILKELTRILKEIGPLPRLPAGFQDRGTPAFTVPPNCPLTECQFVFGSSIFIPPLFIQKEQFRLFSIGL